MAAETTTGAPRAADTGMHVYTIAAPSEASSPSKSPSQSPQEHVNVNATPLSMADGSASEAPAQAGERLASHLDMLAETVRAIVSRVMQSPSEAAQPPPPTAPPTAPPSPPPRSEYSLATRQLCVDKHAAGMSFTQIAAELHMPITSVQTIVQRGAVVPTHRPGRPRVTDASVEATIRKIVAQHPNWSARQVQNQVLATHEELPVSFETIRRRVRDCRKEISSENNDTTNDDHIAPAAINATAVEAVEDAVANARRKRGTEYSPEFRQLCVQKHQSEGKSYQAIANELHVPPDSVRGIVRKAKRTGTVHTAPRSGRPRKTSDLIDRVILQSVKNSQRSTAKQIQDDLASIYHVKVSCETIRRRARDHTKQRLQLVDPGETAVDQRPPPALPSTVPPPSATPGTPAPPPATGSHASGSSTTAAQGSTVAQPAAALRKRKRSEYSLEVREKCVAMHRDGMGFRKIADELKMPHTTVRAIVEKVERTGSMAPAPRSGRPRKTDEILDKVILQTVKANSKCSARMIQQELETVFSVTVSCETIRRRVKDHMRQRHLFAESSTASTAAAMEEEQQQPAHAIASVELPPQLQSPQAQAMETSMAFPLYPLAGEPLGVESSRVPSVMEMMAPPLAFMPTTFMPQQQQSMHHQPMFGGYAPPPQQQQQQQQQHHHHHHHHHHLQSLLRHADVAMHGGVSQHAFAPPSPPSMSDFVL